MKLNDKLALDWEVIKQRWREAQKNDPYTIVAKAFKERQFDAIARILRREEGASVRQALAIPAALLQVPNLAYEELLEEMHKRGAAEAFLYCVSIASRIARECHLPSSLEKIVSEQAGDNPLSKLPYEEFKRMYQIYCDNDTR